MKEHEYITETGERVRVRRGGDVVDVGLSPEVQAEFGALEYFQPLKIGTIVRKDHHLFVAECTRNAAEFYAPVNGRVVACAPSDALISDWLVTLEKGGGAQ